MLSRVAGRRRAGDLRRHLQDPLYRNAYALIVNAILSSGLGLAYWVIVARLYSAEAVGRSAAVIAAIIFLSGLAQLNLRPIMSRFIPVAGSAVLRFILAGYAGATLVALAAALLFLVGAETWAPDEVFESIKAGPVLILGFALTTVLWTVFSIQDGVLIGLRQAILVPIENGLFGVAKIVFAAAFALDVSTRGIGILGSWVIPMLAAVILVSAVVLLKVGRPTVGVSQPGPLISVRRIAPLVAGEYAGSLFALAYGSLVPVLVIAQTDTTTSGHFYVVWVIASSLQLVPLQMALSLVVETAVDPSTFEYRARQMAIQMSRIFGPLLIVLIVFAPQLLQILGPGYAEDGTDLMRLLIATLVPYSVIVLYFARVRAQARVRGIIAVQVALAVSILLTTVLLLPAMGLVGVGVSFFICQTAIAVAVGLHSLRGVLAPTRATA